MSTSTATVAVPYDSEEDDRLTAICLGGGRIEDEIPAEAIAAYERWKVALAAGEPLAVAAHGHLMTCSENALSISALADRIDGPHERAVVEVIFGERHATAVHDVMRNEFMRRREEAPYAQDRVRWRLQDGCVTPADVVAIREDTTRRIRDEDLMAMTMPWELEEEDGSRELRRKVVRGRQVYVCHQTGLPIPAGEPHLAITETCDGEMLTTRHGRIAAWVQVVLEDPSLCEELRPPAEPFQAPLDTQATA